MSVISGIINNINNNNVDPNNNNNNVHTPNTGSTLPHSKLLGDFDVVMRAHGIQDKDDVVVLRNKLFVVDQVGNKMILGNLADCTYILICYLIFPLPVSLYVSPSCISLYPISSISF